MNYQVLISKKEASQAIVDDLKSQLKQVNPVLFLFFVSAELDDLEMIVSQLQEAFPKTVILGSTSAREITSGYMGTKSFVCMSFDKEAFSYWDFEVAENLSGDKQAIQGIVNKLERRLEQPLSELNPEEYVGLLLLDGNSGQEEWVNDQLGNLTNILFVGGTASDTLTFDSTKLFVNGRVLDNASIVLLLKPANGFTTLKTESVKLKGKELVPTLVDESNRRVLEFDGQPARIAYAEAIGVSEEKLEKALYKYPLGLVLDESSPFLRSPKRIIGESVDFFCSVKEGMPLQVLEATDIVSKTREDLNIKISALGGASAIINFNCILRALALEENGQVDEYAQLFKETPTIGFSTYGESYIGHVNQTDTMLILK